MNLPKQAEPLSAGAGPPGGSEQTGARRLSDLSRDITMAQIARAAGVSQGAISSLLNDRDYGIRVSEKTRDRVFKVCREMGYLPNDLRAVVRMYPELGDYAFLICSGLDARLEHPSIHRIAGAAMRAVPDPSQPITFSFYEERTDYTAHPDLLPQPVRCGIASKFVGMGSPNATLLQALARRGLPYVSLGTDLMQPGTMSILPDYQEASLLAIDALVKLGHREIAIVSGPFGTADAQVLELNRGVRLACERLGIETQHVISGDLSFAAGVEGCNALLDRKPAPTAVFCMSDDAAAGVLAQAQARGLKVPAEFSVIGCANDSIAERTLPGLSTVHLPAEDMATLAVQESDRLARLGPPAEPLKKIVAVRLIERGSTGPAPQR